MVEPVRHPAHYTKPSGQVWDVLDEWFPTDPLLWQAGKCLARWNAKGDPVNNLQKAIEYIQRRIDFLKLEQQTIKENTERRATEDGLNPNAVSYGLPVKVVPGIEIDVGDYPPQRAWFTNPAWP